MNWPEKLCATSESSGDNSAREILTEKMATEKTAEGIRKFAADIVKLEQLVAKKLG